MLQENLVIQLEPFYGSSELIDSAAAPTHDAKRCGSNSLSKRGKIRW
jgi:hypothetical protein